MKMSDLHIELTAGTDLFARKVRIISKHLAAMADELDLAKGLEPVKCAYCGKTIRPSDPQWCDVNLNGAYCSQGCTEMAGMEPAVQTIRIHRQPGAISIPELADAVIKRLRDYHGWEV